MMLDTNALSALAEKDPKLIERIRMAPRICVSLISLGEYSFGIIGSRQRVELERWLHAFLQRAEVIFPDMGTLAHYAAIRTELKTAGTPIPANDCWIAALVRQHQTDIVSRDQHFDKVKGVRRISW